nr:immunoglobulin heavy chain junction region [Macaca mulatta]MOW75913.1 immunoglobulin heavy chain junction region [Macaca mulatta]MOW76323.1 immunoglobulin heavy chain junction region [Macaca mulatta]MOW77150.1 immunoglobulin heavy chain junction region [Macaca mulatta]MOW77566.1 immunoglobulin heavy chain junction region [Macaca mulatta]
CARWSLDWLLLESW